MARKRPIELFEELIDELDTGLLSREDLLEALEMERAGLPWDDPRNTDFTSLRNAVKPTRTAGLGPGNRFGGTLTGARGALKGASRWAKWGGRLGAGLTGLGVGASVLAGYDLLDELSGARRSREDYTPDAWANRFGAAYDQRGRIESNIQAETDNSFMRETADAYENTYKASEIQQRAFMNQAARPSKRSMDKLEQLLGSDLDTVKQVSQQSPPSLADFAAAEGIL